MQRYGDWRHVATGCTALVQTKNTQTGRFSGLFSRTTWINRHQKGKIILDFNGGRDDGVAVASAGPYADYLYLAPDS